MCRGIETESGLLNAARDVQAETRYSLYDSLVIAAALQAGADGLYTENLQHTQIVAGPLRIVNPFFGGGQ